MTILVKSKLPGLLAAAVVVLGGSLSAQAQVSTPAELRGYENCLAAFSQSRPNGLTTPRSYYLSKQAATNQYYVNATVWEAGTRVAKRLDCVTSANGRRLQSLAVLDGRFAIKVSRALNVATASD